MSTVATTGLMRLAGLSQFEFHALFIERGKTANKTAVPGLNCAHQNLPYIQVLTVQRERREVVVSCCCVLGLGSVPKVHAGCSRQHQADRRSGC